MLRLDPLVLARWQLDLDRRKTGAMYANLYDHKLDRMRASPLAFLRGAAPLFYEILKAQPELAKGPDGVGWITGDLHLENFGAYRPSAHAADDEPKGRAREDVATATFNLNDFDDAIVGPWRLDVLRLTTSLILGGRELGADGARSMDLADALLDAYVANAFGRSTLPAAPRPVHALVLRVRGRTRKELLDGRTEVRKGERRFVRDDRHYRELPRRLREPSVAAFARYAEKLAEEETAIDPKQLGVLDVAFRVAGTGSLGSLRVAVLARGKGGPDGAWIFDMKEEDTPSAATLVGKPNLKPARRVITAARACLAHPPRMLGATKLEGKSMFVRRLAPQEDKLDLANIDHADLEPLARYLGALAGAAHRRGAESLPKKRWTRGDRDRLLDRAVALAGIHEAVYLAMCKLER